jgi:hypothetical protein
MLTYLSQALLASTTPSSILKNPRLLESRREIAAEVERCTHTAPIFSADGRVALLRLTSGAQVHPVRDICFALLISIAYVVVVTLVL